MYIIIEEVISVIFCSCFYVECLLQNDNYQSSILYPDKINFWAIREWGNNTICVRKCVLWICCMYASTGGRSLVRAKWGRTDYCPLGQQGEMSYSGLISSRTSGTWLRGQEKRLSSTLSLFHQDVYLISRIYQRLGNCLHFSEHSFRLVMEGICIENIN